MANIRSGLRSFNGGELSPEFGAQVTDARYQTGLARCLNFTVLPHGPAENRAGTNYVRHAKEAVTLSRVIPFTYSNTQSMALEFGHNYIRFHTGGATLLSGSPAAYSGATSYVVGDLVSSAGTNYYCVAATTSNAPPNATYWYAMPASGEYEIPTQYDEADLFDIHYVQSADVLTLVHPLYPVRELRRQEATRWVLSFVGFAASLAAPSSITATATTASAPTNLHAYSYKVVAVGDGGKSLSVASSAATCSNNLLQTDAYNDISWASVSGAKLYYVYAQSTGGIHGYIGSSDGVTFRDDNITPDISQTPPIAQALFTAPGDYPGAVSYHEQRRVFAGTNNKPQHVWATRSGTESDMNYSLPTRDDDAITFRIAAREANSIRHLAPLATLVALTGAAEWRIGTADGSPITPASVSVKPQSYNGANNVQPAVVHNAIIFAAARGGHVRELGFSNDAGGYVTGDLSLRAQHLFDGLEVADIAYSKSPTPTVWAVSSSGQLLGLTYVPEEKIGGWHRHETLNGAFESVCVVPEGDEDALYFIVRRTVNGATVRYVERLHTRAFAAQADAYFVDCGSTYTGVATSTVTGLTWLEGETVSILADGAVHADRVVTAGAITLDAPASTVHVGLKITAQLQTMPAAFDAQAFGAGRMKNVNKVYMRVSQSGGIFAGPSFEALTEHKQRTDEPYGSPPDLVTGEIELVIDPSWGSDGHVCIEQTAPLPLTVLAMSLEIAT